jgi:hypothetical protein
MKKTIITLLTALTLSVSGQTQSVVIVDVQEQINVIKANQRASGLLLLEARQNRIDGLLYATTFSILGTSIIAIAKDNVIGKGFGVAFLTVGGTMSFVKLVESFNNIGRAGRVLINRN